MEYTHLSLEEREKLYALKEQGISLQKIGKKLGRSVGTISRELKRNAKYGKTYLPCRAQRLSDKRGWKQRYKAPLKNPLVFLDLKYFNLYPRGKKTLPDKERDGFSRLVIFQKFWS